MPHFPVERTGSPECRSPDPSWVNDLSWDQHLARVARFPLGNYVLVLTHSEADL